MKVVIFTLFFSFLFADSLIIKYLNLNPYYYKNQIVSLKIKFITSNGSNLVFIPPLNSEYNITKITPFVSIMDIKFKNDLKDKNLLILGDGIYKNIKLSSLYKTQSVENISHFSRILADDLKIVNSVATKDEDEIIVSFSIVAKNANLEDFYLLNSKFRRVSKDRINVLSVVKDKDFYFYYFNPIKEQFVKVKVPIQLKENTISTQEDVNPGAVNYFTPLNILILVFIAFLLLLFLVYRYIIFLVFSVIVSGYLVYKFIPKGEVVVKKDANVYILPTKNSTIFYHFDSNQKVLLLDTISKYVKIKFKNKIGWVKKDDVISN